MIDKEKLTNRNARLGLKMGATVFAEGRKWRCRDHKGNINQWAFDTPEQAITQAYERSHAGCMCFDSDNAPHSLLHGPDGLLARLLKTEETWDAFVRLLVGEDASQSLLIVRLCKASSYVIASCADAAMPWPEGV